MAKGDPNSPSLQLLQQQRSHVLLVLSQAKASHQAAFLEWYRGAYREALLDREGILSAQHYEQHEVDITQGHYPRLPFPYLGLYDISVDGAEAAGELLDSIGLLHKRQPAAEGAATWLYYPASEKVGRKSLVTASMLTIAFANAIPGREHEFREWYATRHLRHALNIPAFVSGQCFERTLFQRPGALEPAFSMIAIYEQEGTPQSILESFASIPLSTFHFPAIDAKRFAESVYQLV